MASPKSRRPGSRLARLTSSPGGQRVMIAAAAAAALVLVFFGARMAIENEEISSLIKSLPFLQEDLSVYPRLQEVVFNASLGNRTVVLTAVSTGWAEMLNLFLERLHKGNNTAYLLEHTIIVAFDKGSYRNCSRLQLEYPVFCYYDHRNDTSGKSDTGSEPVVYMTPEYLDLVWRKVEVQRAVLTMGYDILFTDLDTLWFQDPLPVLEDLPVDMAVSSDIWKEQERINVSVNTGVMYARSNFRTLLFYRHWMSIRSRMPSYTDQDAFSSVRPEGDEHTRNIIRIRMHYLDTTTFGNFCETSEGLMDYVAIHASCCPLYYQKIASLKEVATDWDWIKAQPTSMRESMNEHGFTWTPITCPEVED